MNIQDAANRKNSAILQRHVLGFLLLLWDPCRIYFARHISRRRKRRLCDRFCANRHTTLRPCILRSMMRSGWLGKQSTPQNEFASTDFASLDWITRVKSTASLKTAYIGYDEQSLHVDVQVRTRISVSAQHCGNAARMAQKQSTPFALSAPTLAGYFLLKVESQQSKPARSAAKKQRSDENFNQTPIRIQLLSH